MKKEIMLRCNSGITQYYKSIENVLNDYNEHGNLYEIRDNRLWHKGHNMVVGELVEIELRK